MSNGILDWLIGDIDYLRGHTSMESATIGSHPQGRPAITNGPLTLSVPTDYDTIQDALNAIPQVVRHKVQIDVDAGTYDEDLFVPSFLGQRMHDGRSKAFPPVAIVGDPATPSNVQVNSAIATGSTGQLYFDGLEFTGDTPLDDDNSALMVFGASEVIAKNVSFTAGPTNGITVYGGHLHVNSVDFGASNLAIGYWMKHGGSMEEEPAVSTPSKGNVTDTAYYCGQGSINFQGNSSTLTADTSLVSTANGKVLDSENNREYGGGRYVNRLYAEDGLDMQNEFIREALGVIYNNLGSTPGAPTDGMVLFYDASAGTNGEVKAIDSAGNVVTLGAF